VPRTLDDRSRLAREETRFRALLLLVLGGGAVAAAALLVGEMRMRRAVLERRMVERCDRASREFQSFVRPIQEKLTLIQGWAQGGDLDLSDPDRLEARLGPLFDPLPQVAAVSLLAESGRELRLTRSESGWEAAYSGAGHLELLTSRWYRALAGSEVGTPSWTGLEARAGTPQGGVIAALRWRQAPGSQPSAVGLEISERAVQDLADRMPVGADGLLLVEDRDGDLLWLSPAARDRFSADSLAGLLRSGNPWSGLIAEALYSWHGSDVGQATRRLRWDGRTWWVRWVPLDLPRAGDLGLLVSQATLGEDMETLTSPFILTLLGVVGVGVLALARIAARYRRRFALAGRPRVVGSGCDLQELIAEGEGETLELKSTMRHNLKTDKPGKEIELAWLKALVAFMNSKGGTLLIGVDDSGAIRGLAADRFPNADRCLLHLNNLVHQHIGAEHARHLASELREVDGRQVLVVEATAAGAPVFLRHGEEEDFYVRAGPASRRLTPRQMLEYLGSRPPRAAPDHLGRPRLDG